MMGGIDARVEEVLRDIEQRFGPGVSNGVYAILLHADLPKTFGRDEWAKWQFKPADAAFDWAHDRGLVSPWKLSSKWTFTDLGAAVAAHVQLSTRIESVPSMTPRQQKAAERAARARELSAQGMSMDDAAAALGMKVLGLKQLLRREFGSGRWPVR